MVVAKDYVPFTKFIGLRVTPEDMKSLKKIAKEKRLRVSVLVRTIIADFLDREAKNSKQT